MLIEYVEKNICLAQKLFILQVMCQLFGRIFEAFRYNTFLSFCDYVQKVCHDGHIAKVIIFNRVLALANYNV